MPLSVLCYTYSITDRGVDVNTFVKWLLTLERWDGRIVLEPGGEV